MKVIRYGKYVGEPADAVDLDELVKRMGDFFLQSGFESQYFGVSEMDNERSMEALKEAILRALQEGDLLPEDAMSEELRKMLQSPQAQNSQAVKDLLEKLMERLARRRFHQSAAAAAGDAATSKHAAREPGTAAGTAKRSTF